MDLEGTVCWVVGASSGIGAAVAREMRARGARVAVSARRQERLAAVGEGAMLTVPADVTDAAAMVGAADRVVAELGVPDVVIAAAGQWQPMRVDDWDTDLFRRQVEVNLIGMGNTVGAALPHLLARGSGVLAGIASLTGYRGLPRGGAYTATKAAQLSLLEDLRAQLAPRGIRVTTISPGFVRTPLTHRNRFPMPFIIDADAAGRAVCDGLERERTEIAFPLRMALLAKAARFVPVRAWPHLWSAVGRGQRAVARR